MRLSFACLIRFQCLSFSTEGVRWLLIKCFKVVLMTLVTHRLEALPMYRFGLLSSL